MKRKKWQGIIRNAYDKTSILHPLNFFVPLVDQVKDGVVSIVTEDMAPSPDMTQFIRHFLKIPPFDPGNDHSFGSGLILHPGGYILTNEHVVGRSKLISVKLTNGRVFEAKRVLADRQRDFAVLKINPDCRLKALPLGSSRASRVGEWVISIGAPLGLENSVTAGIISAKNRKLQVSHRSYEEVLQTDAAINPGNSGGPLINLKGEVIGLNAFIIQSSQSLGFSIGIDSLKPHIRPFLPH